MLQIFHILQTYVYSSVSCFRCVFRESWGHGPGARGSGAASRVPRVGARGTPSAVDGDVPVLILAPGSRPRGERERSAG
jgi:hypothetical protein